MAQVIEKFEPLKAAAAVAYLSQKSGETIYTVLKMLYVADRHHLEMFARTITGDRYVAMDQGAVASATYDILKCARGKAYSPSISAVARRFFAVDANNQIQVLEEPDQDELSDSDVNSLDHALAIYQLLGGPKVRDEAHDAAWHEARKSGGNSPPMPLLMIAETLKNGKSLVDHLLDPVPGSA